MGFVFGPCFVSMFILKSLVLLSSFFTLIVFCCYVAVRVLCVFIVFIDVCSVIVAFSGHTHLFVSSVHGKSNRMTCTPCKYSNQPGHNAHSDQRLCCLYKESLNLHG